MARFNTRDLWFPRYENARNFDFTAPTTDADGESIWDFWQFELLENGRHVVFGSDEATWTRHNTRTGEVIQNGDPYWEPEESTAEGPIMSYWWPLGESLPHTERETAWLMRRLNTCLVRVDDIYGVALTAGGMDLSWDLAASAVAAGFFPWSGLSLSQGGVGATWRYGVGELGEAKAKQVRAALRARLRSDRQMIGHRLRDLDGWK